MKLFRLLSLGLLCLGILSTNVQAETLVSYGFDDDTPTTELAQLTGSAGNLMRGSAWTLGSGFGNSNRDLILTNPNAAPQKIEFDYTVTGLLAGQTLDIDDITIDIRGEDSNNNAYVLNSTDITGGVVGNVLGRVNNPEAFGTTFATFHVEGPLADPISALPLQTGLINGSVIRFKFGWRDAQAGTQTYEVDNFVVNGTINGTVSAVKGDVDTNGVVNFLDINPFIVLLAANGYSAEADCDCDGDLDFLDIQPFIAILSGL